MYKANLAWTRMLKYLDFLVCQGLIEECVEEEGKRYYITRKGIGRLAAMGIVAFYPKSSIFQKIDPFYWSYHIKDKFSGLFETFNLFCLRFWMPRQTMIRFEYIIANEVYKAQKFNTGGYGFRFNSQLNKKFFVCFLLSLEI